MKLTFNGRKTLIIVVLVTVAIVGAVTWLIWSQQQAAWRREVIKKTDVAEYSELSKEDLNNRSKAIFGKSVDELAKSEINVSDGEASPQEAGKILIAAGKTNQTIAAFKLAESHQSEKVDQELYRNYRNSLDAAGRHDEATDLLRHELELLKKETPQDVIAIWRVESQITEREEYYK